MSDEPSPKLLAPIGVGTHRDVGGVEEDIFRAGDANIKRVVYPAGYRWSVHLKPHVGTELCMHAHVGFLAEGHMRIQYEDGCEIDVVAPQPVVIHPGHDAEVIGDATAVSTMRVEGDGEPGLGYQGVAATQVGQAVLFTLVNNDGEAFDAERAASYVESTQSVVDEMN